MLAVARRFAAAYMPYQVGRLPDWARAAIKRTCAPAFADYLLARPAEESPLLSAHHRCRDISRRRRQPRRGLEPRLRELLLKAGSGGHRRIPADARPAPRPLVGCRAGDVNGGAKAVAVRAGAHDPPAAAGGDAHTECGQRIRGAVPANAWLRQAGRSAGFRRRTFRSFRERARSSRSALGARRSSQRSTTSSRHSTPPPSQACNRAPTAREPQGQCRSASTEPQATRGTRSSSTPRAIRRGSRRTSTTRPTPSTAPPLPAGIRRAR